MGVSIFLNYHQTVADALSCKPLPRDRKVAELINRIAAVVVAPFAYLILGLIALISYPFENRAVSHTRHNSNPLQGELQNIFQRITAQADDNPSNAKYARGGAIKFGRSQSGVYLEVKNRQGAPRHFDIYANGSGRRIDAHWNRGYPPGVRMSNIARDDLSIINWALGQIGQQYNGRGFVAPQQNIPPQFVGKHIQGHIVQAADQEQPKGAYNWKNAYMNSPLPNMQNYVHQANNAIIAYRGVLSNFQQTPFKDPVTQVWMKSAEHMFQGYKFPDQRRQQVLNQNTPKQALDEARRHARFLTPGSNALNAWIACNLNLMIYIQLCKSLEDRTQLRQELLNSGNDFIIEDTSRTGEKFWGDCGNGQGANQLGWAQMQVRDIIRSGNFSEAYVIQYFNQSVRVLLQNYYAFV